MVQSRHPRAAACTAALVLLVVPAVAGWSSGPAGGAGASGAVSLAAPARPVADEPADPAAAKAEIEKNWTAFFDAKATTEQRVALLEHGDLLEFVIDTFADNPNVSKASVKVKDVAFTSPTEAKVTYDLLISGASTLPDSKGIAVLDDGIWKVSLKSLCGLIELTGDEAPPPC